MKRKSPPITKIIIGVLISLIILFSINFIYNSIGIIKDIPKGQSNDEIELMKNHSDEELLKSLTEIYQHPDSVFTTVKGIITITRDVSYQEFTYVTPGYSLFMFIIMGIQYFFALCILINLCKIYITALSEKVFVKSNLKRIRNISWLLLGYAVYDILFGLFGNTMLVYLFNSSLYKPRINIDLEYIIQLLFIVFLVLGLSQFFRIGIHLKEDNDLTV